MGKRRIEAERQAERELAKALAADLRFRTPWWIDGVPHTPSYSATLEEALASRNRVVDRRVDDDNTTRRAACVEQLDNRGAWKEIAGTRRDNGIEDLD